MYTLFYIFYIYVFYSQMKDKWIKDKVFKLKIADLLNETGRSDEIVFEKKFSDELLNLNDEWISGILSIQSLDAYSLLWTLSNIKASLNEVCDSCWSSYIRNVEIPLYISRFVLENKISEEEKIACEDPILIIDSKDETINIEDMILQAILLNDPFVKRCDFCSKRLENVDDDDDLDEFISTGNIHFS